MPSFRDRLATHALTLSGKIPLAVNRGIARFVGEVLCRVPNPVRQVTETNLQLAYPSATRDWITDTARQSILQTTCTAFEMGWVWTRPPEDSLALIRSVEGKEKLDAAVAAGKGVVLLIPHIGNWEIAGYYLATHYDFTAMYKPGRNEALNEVILHARKRLSASIVPADNGGVMALYRRLRKGQIIAILPDQEPDSNGAVFSPFFGVPALTQTLGPRLIRESGAAALGYLCLRDETGEGYRIHFVDTDTDIRHEDTDIACRALNASVERWVQLALPQWQWEYKRFGKRPPGTPRRYPSKRG